MRAGETAQPLKARLTAKNKIKENKTITKDKATINSWTWWCMLVIPVLGKQRQREGSGSLFNQPVKINKCQVPERGPFRKSKQLLRNDTGS